MSIIHLFQALSQAILVLPSAVPVKLENFRVPKGKQLVSCVILEQYASEYIICICILFIGIHIYPSYYLSGIVAEDIFYLSNKPYK